MNQMRKKISALLVLAVSILMLFTAAPVKADSKLTSEYKTGLAESTRQLLDQIFVMEDAQLDQVKESGGFYEVMVDAIKENRDTLGSFKKSGDVRITEQDSQVVATSTCTFEKYKADIQLYFSYNDTSKSYEPKNFVINPDYPLSVKMEQAAGNTVIGLIVVFAMLFFLCFVIWLFRFLNRPEKKSEPEQKPEIPVKPAAKPASAPAAAAAPADTEDEIAAVIAAALAAAEADDVQPPVEGYFVRSIKRSDSSRRWKRA